jgi:hypothetical protein
VEVVIFLGSMPTPLRQVLTETVRGWSIDELWVACSGNLTVERTFPELVKHSNDVSIYSCALGWWASGQPMPFTLKMDAAAELGWLEPYLDTRTGILATIMLSTRFLDSAGKANAYHERNLRGWRSQFPRLHAQTVDRIEKSGLSVASYAAKDALQWLQDDVPASAAVVSYPPFDTGGYEAMWKALDATFDWPAPTYPVLDEGRVKDLVDLVADREHWMLGVVQQQPQLEPYLVGRVQTTNRARPFFVYASAGSPKRNVGPHQRSEPVHVPRLAADDHLTGDERITIAALTAPQFVSLRSQYLDPTIAPALPLLQFAVLADGKILGCLAFNGPDGSAMADKNSVYMLSDFPVAPTSYDRLASFIAMCAQSAEVQLLCQRSLSRRVNSIVTTAFSNNQVSMKYRTAKLTLAKRVETPQDPHHRYMLNYTAPAGRWTLAEAYRQWFKTQSDKITGRPKKARA